MLGIQMQLKEGKVLVVLCYQLLCQRLLIKFGNLRQMSVNYQQGTQWNVNTKLCYYHKAQKGQKCFLK